MVFPQVLCGFYVFGVTASCEILLQNFSYVGFFGTLNTTKASANYFFYIQQRSDISMANSSKTRQLTPNQLIRIRRTTVELQSTLNDYLHNHSVYLIHFFLEKKIWMRLKKGRRVEVCVLCYQPQ